MTARNNNGLLDKADWPIQFEGINNEFVKKFIS